MPDLSDVRACLECVATLVAAFYSAASDLDRQTLNKIMPFSSTSAWKVMCDTVNDGLRL